MRRKTIQSFILLFLCCLCSSLSASVVVTFNSQGGSRIEAQTSNSAGKITYPGPAVKPGYLFAGWYETSDGSGLPVLFPYAVSSNKTLYAKWISESDFASNRLNYCPHAMQYSVFRSDARIVDIAMLGAHDAFTHKITSSSPLDPGDDNYSSLKLIDWIAGSTIAKGAKAQFTDGYEMARYGCRLFDTRICYHPDEGTWYTMHAKMSDVLSSYLKNILRFVSENKREVVILYIWPESAVHLNGSNYTSLWNYIANVKYEDKNIFDYIHFNPNTKALKDLTYGDVIGADDSSGIVLFCLNSSGSAHQAYTSSSSVRCLWHDTNNITTLLNSIQSESENIANNWSSYKDRLRIMQAQRTSSSGDNLETMANEFNYRVADDSRFESWLEKTPVFWFDNITATTNQFNQTINKRIHNFNVGSVGKTLPDGVRTSTSLTVGAGIENWYYLAFMKSNSAAETDAPPYYVSDAGANTDVALDTKFIYDNKENQMKLRWKIVPASSGKYYIVSQNGRYLNGAQASTTTCTWSITQQRGSWNGYWQLNQNGDASKIFAHYDNAANLWTDPNKTTGNNGTAMLFLPAPQTSLSGDEHWYYLVSTRPDATYGKVLQDNGSNSTVTTETLSPNHQGQFWQIKNHHLGNFELRSKTGNRMKVVGGDGSTVATGSGYSDGNNYAMAFVEGGQNVAGFNIYNRTKLEGTDKYLYLSPESTAKYWAKTTPHCDYSFDFIPVSFYDVVVNANAFVSAEIKSPANAVVGTSFQAAADSEIEITYSVENGFTPNVSVNYQAYNAGTYANGQYTLKLKITGTTQIAINTTGNFTANTVLVSADTYVRGGNENSNNAQNTNFATADRLNVEYSTYHSPSYVQYTYLQFDLTAAQVAQYNRGKLKLTFARHEQNDRETQLVVIRKAADNLPAISQMTWNSNSETANENNEDVSEIVQLPMNQAANTGVSFDVNLHKAGVKNNRVLLQVAVPNNTGCDRWTEFYSMEGAAAANNGNAFVPRMELYYDANIPLAISAAVPDDNDVLERQYYNLQGVPILQAPKNQRFIERVIYRSGAVQILKK